MDADNSLSRKRKQSVQAVLDRNAELIYALHSKLNDFGVSVCPHLLLRVTYTALYCAQRLNAPAALQRSRTDLEASPVERILACEARDNMISLSLAHPPNVCCQ